MWRFFDYVTERGENLMQQWYNAQLPEVQAGFDARLVFLRTVTDWGDFEDWDNPPFKPLRGKHAGLGEIRFHVESVNPTNKKPHRIRFRPVGMWPVQVENEFVLILGCKKVRATYTPHAALDRAIEHLADLKNGKGGTVEHA